MLKLAQVSIALESNPCAKLTPGESMERMRKVRQKKVIAGTRKAEARAAHLPWGFCVLLCLF